MLSSLSASEVSGLSAAQAQAVGRVVMGLEAQARLLMRQAAAGQLDLVGLTPAEGDALAWRLHTGGTAAAEELVQLVLAQVGKTDSQLSLLFVFALPAEGEDHHGKWVDAVGVASP